METPWKIQCPDCRRFFPSNDFGSFYQLGLDENGNFRYEQAKEKNAELIAAGKDGYLKNVLYPEKGEGWGVDDGYGYVTGRDVYKRQGVASVILQMPPLCYFHCLENTMHLV